jgi:hypothetical protein
MMKLKPMFRFLVSFGLIQCLLWNPLAVNQAQAFPDEDRYNSVCKPVLEASDAEKKADPTLGGSQASAACTNAKNAKTMYQVELAKTIIFSLAAATFLTLAILDSIGKVVGADINSVCMGISTGLGIAMGLVDMGFAKAASSTADHWVSSVKPIGSGLQSLGMVILQAFSKSAAQNAVDKAGCWIAFGLSTVNAILSGFGIEAATQAIKKNLDVAKAVRDNVGANEIKGNFGPHNMPSSVAPTAATAPTQTAAECEKVQGDGYLSCINQTAQDPVLSAMTSDRGLMNGFKKLLGKPLGDFVKSYKGDASPGSIGPYVANGMGLPGLGEHLTKALEKAKEDLNKNPEQASRYLSKSAPAKKSEMNDFNALMKNMFKQLEPLDTKKKEDPKALVFRRLDAMSDERILDAKDISLFDRISNRYRKKTDHEAAPSNPDTQRR